MCRICERSACICLPDRPTTQVVLKYTCRLNDIIDKKSLTLKDDDVKKIIYLRSKLIDWQEFKSVEDIHHVIFECTKTLLKYMF